MFKIDKELITFSIIEIESNIAAKLKLLQKPIDIFHMDKNKLKKFNYTMEEEKSKGSFPAVYYKLIYYLDNMFINSFSLSKEEISTIINIIKENESIDYIVNNKILDKKSINIEEIINKKIEEEFFPSGFYKLKFFLEL